MSYISDLSNVFERRESKCCGVLMKHCCKVKGEQMITLQIAQQLKTKNINVVPGQLFSHQCNAKFLLRQTHCINDQDKAQSFTDTENEFTEYQTLRKKFQTNGISPVSLQAFIKNLKSDISNTYKLQVDWLKDLESDSYDKNDMK